MICKGADANVCVSIYLAMKRNTYMFPVFRVMYLMMDEHHMLFMCVK